MDLPTTTKISIELDTGAVAISDGIIWYPKKCGFTTAVSGSIPLKKEYLHAARVTIPGESLVRRKGRGPGTVWGTQAKRRKKMYEKVD